jgi:hypothetical protein
MAASAVVLTLAIAVHIGGAKGGTVAAICNTGGNNLFS